MNKPFIAGCAGESPDPAAKNLSSEVNAALKQMQEFVDDTPEDMPEVAQSEVDAFREVTYLLIGAILHHHKRKAVTLTDRELKKFAESNLEVVKINMPNGDLRYELQKKAKVK